jgi:hypothetical protein
MKASGSDTGGRDIYRCGACTVFFCYPLPDQEELISAYDEYSDENFVSQNEFRYRTFKNSFVKFLREVDLPQNEISVCDIGAAGGVFLKCLGDLGYLSNGFEVNSWLVNYGVKNYKVNLIQGSSRDFIPSDDKLDVITFWDVLEHLSEPKKDLRDLSLKLKKNSIIFVSLPSTDSKSFKIMGWKWPMHLDVHLFYYNKKSLEILFESLGLKKIYQSNYPQELSLGYLLFRAFRILFPRVSSARLDFLIEGFLNSFSIRYSIGQRVFAFQKI